MELKIWNRKCYQKHNFFDLIFFYFSSSPRHFLQVIIYSHTSRLIVPIYKSDLMYILHYFIFYFFLSMMRMGKRKGRNVLSRVGNSRYKRTPVSILRNDMVFCLFFCFRFLLFFPASYSVFELIQPTSIVILFFFL